MPKIDILNSCSLPTTSPSCLEALTEHERAVLEANSVWVEYKKGEMICKQGTFASHVMILWEGLAKIFIEGAGKSLILKILPSVNLVGLSLLNDESNTFHYSAKAYLDSKVQLIDIKVFKETIQNNALFASKIIGILGENSIIVNGRFFCLTKKQTFGRFADILLCLSQRIYKQHNFPLQLSRKELGELSEMSVESIARIITKFKEDGLIEVTNKEIKILDMDRLLMISTNG